MENLSRHEFVKLLYVNRTMRKSLCFVDFTLIYVNFYHDPSIISLIYGFYFLIWHESAFKYFHFLCLLFEEFHVRFFNVF